MELLSKALEAPLVMERIGSHVTFIPKATEWCGLRF